MRSAALQALFSTLHAELAPDGALHGELGRQAYQKFVLPLFDKVPDEGPAGEGGRPGREGGGDVP